MLFESMDRIVFAGDSVTDMGSIQPVGEGRSDNLGFGYVRVLENLLSVWYPERILRITNSGINGHTSRDLLQRFDRDVMQLHPDWVSICIGINDVWRQFDMPAFPEQWVSPEEYEKNLEAMILRCKGTVKGIFICTPYYMEPNREDAMRKRMNVYGEICRKLSEKHGCRFVDFQSAYDNFFRHYHSTFIAWDRVHPNQIGSTLMAKTFLEECDFDYLKKPCSMEQG